MNKNKEYRSANIAACREFKEQDEEKQLIVEGYAAVIEQPTVICTIDGVKYCEIIDKDAFIGADLSDVPFKYKVYEIIYKPENRPVYIGSTKQSLKKRFLNHRSDSRRQMYHVFKKYGVENFCIVGIAYTDNKRISLELEEKITLYCMQFYELYNQNIAAHAVYTEERKAKLKKSLTNNPNVGHPWPEHQYEIMRDRMSGENNPSARNVFCITTGELFPTMKEAKEKYNAKNIFRCCIGKGKYSGKLEDGTPLQWQYAS